MQKLVSFVAVIVNAAGMLVSISGMASTVLAPTRVPVQQMPGASGAWFSPGVAPACCCAISDLAGVQQPCRDAVVNTHAPAPFMVSQRTTEPIRWPEYQREPAPQPIPSRQPPYYHRPASSLSWSSYGRAPDGGTTTSFRRWPQSGHIYPPPYSSSPPEPVRWPEYRH